MWVPVSNTYMSRLYLICVSEQFFDFHTTTLDQTLVFPSAIVSLALHSDSGLLAAICDDQIVRIIDIETRRIVRELSGFRSKVLDVVCHLSSSAHSYSHRANCDNHLYQAFSPDARWLIATSLDSIIRTFDVPTGRLIDAFRTSSVATSISFSPTNDFLATSHVDSVGVYLWANRAQYAEVTFQGISDDEVTDVALPSVQGEAEDEGEQQP